VVEAGEVLLRLDSRLLEAQRELAKAGGEAAVAAAQLELIAAQQALDALNEDAVLAAAQAELALANARDAFDDAVRLNTYQQKGNRATTETLDAAEAAVTLAENAVDSAQAAYNRLGHLTSDNPTKAAAGLPRSRTSAAGQRRGHLNWYWRAVRHRPGDLECQGQPRSGSARRGPTHFRCSQPRARRGPPGNGHGAVVAGEGAAGGGPRASQSGFRDT
jgi:multidrug efflux pump subunit AcrA (membrane-fusion protein)